MNLYITLTTEAREKYFFEIGKSFSDKEFPIEIGNPEYLSIEDRKILIDNCLLRPDGDLKLLYKKTNGIYFNNIFYNPKIEKNYSYQCNFIEIENIISELKTNSQKNDDEILKFQNAVKFLSDFKKLLQEKSTDLIKFTICREDSIYINGSEVALDVYNIPEAFFEKQIEEKMSIILKREKEKNRAEKEKNDSIKLQNEGKDKLKKWGIENGSDLLKARIQENMNWYSMANSEYLLSICPKNFFLDKEEYDESWEIKDATLEQIKELREAKKIDPDAKLIRYKYIIRDKEQYEDEITHNDYVAIDLNSIDGFTTQQFIKKI